MQVPLNCHLATFIELEWTVHKAAKRQFNNTSMCNCFSLFRLASYVHSYNIRKLYPLGRNSIYQSLFLPVVLIH